jgi:integrase
VKISPLYSYLVRTKTGAFRYRRRVPANVRQIIGKTEIVQSLQTRETRLLPMRYAEVHAEVERLFEQARTEGGVTNDVIFEAALRSLRARGLPTLESDKQWSNEDRSEAVDVVLSQAGYQDIEELEEAFSTTSDKATRHGLLQVSTEIAIVQGSATRPRPNLSHCLRLLLQDRARRKSDLNRRDWINYERERKRIIADLVKQIGDKEITDIRRADARVFQKHLEANYAPASVRKQLTFVRSLIDFGLQEFELVGINPFKGLAVTVPEDEDENGISFDYAEVRTLLSETSRINDELQEIVRLLACTGARLSEITGLEIQNVDADAATISLDFNSIRRLKNRKSVRLIPVVDDLAIKQLRARAGRAGNGKPTDPFFPRYGWDGGGNTASAALGKWLTTIKLRDPKADKVKTTHSLRHTFKDALREANINRDIANMLQGHTAGDAASDYGSSELLNAKRQAAEKAWTLINPLAVNAAV